MVRDLAAHAIHRVNVTPAHVAQLVEHFLGKEEVTGSIPVVSPAAFHTVGDAPCGGNSVGRVTAFQAVGRGFESRPPLYDFD